jgi:hypothetical protein
MSDYLTRLIERSLGAAPQIEPLIAPLHAPPQQIRSEETETISPSPAKIEFSERSTAPGNRANGKTSEAASSKSESQRFRDSRPLSGSPAGFPVDPSAGPPDSGASRQASSPPAPGAFDPASVPLSPPMLSRESTRVVVEREIIERPRSAAATEGPHRLPEDQSRIVVQPEIIGRHKPPESSGVPAPHTFADEPPAIHVTIGRVEVRAVMSPSAPPKVPSRAAPKLSLEDYLKQRNRTSR